MAYANEYKIDFRSDKHRNILPRLVNRIRLAETASGSSKERWIRNEELYSSYIDYESADRLKKSTTTDKGRPEYVTLYVPYSYAMLLSAHTYLTSTMFSRDPVWQYRGRHGEGEQQVMAMEALISYQVVSGGHLPNYYVWTHDSLRYGFGVLGVKWCKEMIRSRRFVEEPKTFMGFEVGGTKKTEVVEEIPGYEGNRTYNVRPADFGWDPRFPVVQFQQGEFVTSKCQISRMDLLDPGTYFNQKFLSEASGGASYSDNNSALDIPSQSLYQSTDPEDQDKLYEAHNVYVRLIPSEWGLGKGNRPEKWYFVVVGKSLIVCARPMDSYSNLWPFAITPGEVEGYDRVPRSMLETTEALNNTLSWLLNSHMYNVRATLNNQLIVDPSRLMISDLMGPNPGKLVRMKPTAYGQDARTMYSQLGVSDITRSNVSDMDMIASLLQRTSGINDNMMGQVNSGRRTATETRSTNTMGISRMKTLVEYQSACGYSPLSQLFVQNSQQYYSGEKKLRIVGDAAPYQLESFINVTPESIAGFYDLIPVDGTMPVDRLAMVTMWQQFMAAAAQIPGIPQQYDFGRIFAYVAQMAGLRDIKQFKVQVVPPGMGMPSNVVPLKGMPGMDNSGAPVQPQLPQMGPVG